MNPVIDTAGLSSHLCELEELLLQPDIRQSKRHFELIADDFLEFGSSGRTYNKDTFVNALQVQSVPKESTADFRVSFLATGVALITYRVHRHSVPPVDTLHSSIWRQQDGQWQMAFHQATITILPYCRYDQGAH